MKIGKINIGYKKAYTQHLYLFNDARMNRANHGMLQGASKCSRCIQFHEVVFYGSFSGHASQSGVERWWALENSTPFCDFTFELIQNNKQIKKMPTKFTLKKSQYTLIITSNLKMLQRLWEGKKCENNYKCFHHNFFFIFESAKSVDNTCSYVGPYFLYIR